MGWLIDLLTSIEAVCFLSSSCVRGSACTDILSVAKALALSEPMTIFYAGHGKSWLVNSATLAEHSRI